MELKPLRVLYIDDDPDDLEFLTEAIGQMGSHITIHCIRDSRTFLSEVKQFHPDLIFLDYNMPLVDGRSCLVLLKADRELANIPTIMYCTSSSRTTLTECYSLGAVRYLLKPVNYSGIIKGLNLIFNLHYEGRLIPSDFGDFFIDTYKLN